MYRVRAPRRFNGEDAHGESTLFMLICGAAAKWSLGIEIGVERADRSLSANIYALESRCPFQHFHYVRIGMAMAPTLEHSPLLGYSEMGLGRT